jgi:hypothetical protein
MDLFKQSTKYREFLLFKKLKEMEDTEDDVSVLHSKLPAKKYYTFVQDLRRNHKCI